MVVVHGWWDGALVLWAEDPAEGAGAGNRSGARGRKGRSVRRHPFAVPAPRLGAALHRGEDSSWDTGEAVLDLPSSGGLPLASPDLPGFGALPEGGTEVALAETEVPVPDTVDGGQPAAAQTPEAAVVAPELVGWRLPVVRLPAAEALPFLGGLTAGAAGAAGGDLGDGVIAGADLRHLALIAATADALARRGRVLPSVVAEQPAAGAGGRSRGARSRGGADGPTGSRSATATVRARACWLPVLTGADARHVRDLVLALPAAARTPGGPASGTVADALDALTDAAVRERMGRARVPRRARGSGTATRQPAGGDPILAWRTALTGQDPQFWIRPDELALLRKLLQEWQADAVGGPVRAQFRLVEPGPGVEPGQPQTVDPVPGADAGAAGARWTVEFGLQAADEPSLVVGAERVWRSRGRLAALARYVPAPQETLLAELGRALRLYPGLEPALRTARPVRLELDASGAYDFLREGAPTLAAAGFGVQVPSWWGRSGARLGVRAKVSTPSQPGATEGRPTFGQEALVDFRWEVALGDETLTESELTALADLQQPLVRVRGQWVELDSQRLRNGLKLVRENGSGELTLGQLLQVAGSGEGGPGDLPVVGVEADGWLGDLLSGAAPARVEPVPVPEGFAGVLRPYQERGLAWLTFLQRLGLGAVLADDMGLGKTVQLLALMAGDDAADGAGPTLLVCPMSLVGNWQREAARFTPQLRVHVHHGAERPRGKAFRDAVASADLVVTTYALAARDAAALSAVDWRRVVLDEAQAVKNAATKAATAVRGLPARHRIAVTGTPVENRLADLWSLMEFANSGLLGTPTRFKQRFAVPIERHADPDATARLRAVTQPFILRRVKTDRDVIADLPEKLEMEVVCGLTREQASLYQAVVDDMLRRVADSEGMERRGLVLATMTKLKQVCNHPAQLLRDGSRLAGRSGKLSRLEEILEEVLAAGEKALLFTQFAEFGAMLRAHLSARFGREVLFLHGGVPKAERDVMVSRFQSGTPGGPALFVLSLKAGGTGLTLTEANHVIHVDRWWNPAVEDQATDRAFRIGQTRNVQVRKLVCGGTLEERIAVMIRDKRGLASSIVGTGEGWLTELSTEQLRELVRLDGDSVVE